MNLATVNTKDLIEELSTRGTLDTDNEGQYVIYTGVYEK